MVGTEDKNLLKNIKGKSIINMLKEREINDRDSLVGRITALERRKKIADTKVLAETLLLIRREGINNEGDFDSKINELRTKAGEIKDVIKNVESKNEQYKDAVKCLITFNKHLPVKQELEKLSHVRKSGFEKRHESELLAFNYAAAKLEKMGVNTNADAEKVINLIKDYERRIKELSSRFKEVERHIDELKKGKGIVESIVNPHEQKRHFEEKNKEME